MQKEKIDEMMTEIKSMDNEKNIGIIMKKYNKINDDIKILNSEILNLKKEFEETSENTNVEIDDETFKKYSEEISDEKINIVLDEKNLKKQIDEYKKIVFKINACQQFLESKKMNVVEIDSQKKQKIIKKKIIYSSESDSC